MPELQVLGPDAGGDTRPGTLLKGMVDFGVIPGWL